MSLPVIYDVAIVGAGPAGSTCAWYLAQQGHRVVILERKRFPRDKICGDAVCSQAQVHLRQMRVLQKIIDNDEGRFAAVGGMVSARGISYINDPKDHLDSSPVIAIKRIFLDIRIAHAARDRKTRVMASSSAMKAAGISSCTSRSWTAVRRW